MVRKLIGTCGFLFVVCNLFFFLGEKLRNGREVKNEKGTAGVGEACGGRLVSVKCTERKGKVVDKEETISRHSTLDNQGPRSYVKVRVF